MRLRPFRNDWIYWFVLCTALAGLVALRAFVIDGRLAEGTGCRNCFYAPAVAGDLPGVLLLLAIVWLAARTGRTASLLLRFIAIAAVLIYLVDLAVYLQFGFRVSLAEMSTYGRDWHATLAFLRQYWPGDSWAMPNKEIVWLVVVAVILLCCLGWPRKARPVEGRRLLAVIGPAACGAAVLGAFGPAGSEYVWHQIYQNVVPFNLGQHQNKAYSDAFAAAALREPAPAPACAAGRDTRDSVVLIVVESLSATHSAAYGGTDDWLPRLDAWSRRGERFENFIANGFTTDHGLIASLTGLDPLPIPGRYDLLTSFNVAFQGVYAAPTGLPRRLQPLGYESAFFFGGDLSFIGTRDWLESLGFDHVEGNEFPGYASEPRFNFSAVQDRALYRRVARWLAERRNSRPALAVISTVSTHIPFRDPESGSSSAEAAFRYADRAIGEFLDDLERQGYFEHGIVLITADHREMTPVRSGEVERFRSTAPARIPLVAIGHSIRSGTRRELFQQADIPSSIEALVGPSGCFAARQRNLFGPVGGDVAGRCVLHVRGDQRERVSAFCDGNVEGEIELRGDATRVVTGDRKTLEPLVAEVNRVRIERSQSFERTATRR